MIFIVDLDHDLNRFKSMKSTLDDHSDSSRSSSASSL